MAELEERDAFFLNVGKCLSAWNSIEADILRILEYACMDLGSGTTAEVRAIRDRFWSTISFDARLRWCDEQVSRRLFAPDDELLAGRWRTLRNKVGTKAKKRAKVAHGSVVTLVKGSDTAHKQVMFIPYMNRSIDNLIDKLPMKDADVFSGLHYLRVAEIAEMTESFWNLSGQLSKFVVDWMLKESSTKQR